MRVLSGRAERDKGTASKCRSQQHPQFRNQRCFPRSKVPRVPRGPRVPRVLRASWDVSRFEWEVGQWCKHHRTISSLVCFWQKWMLCSFGNCFLHFWLQCLNGHFLKARGRESSTFCWDAERSEGSCKKVFRDVQQALPWFASASFDDPFTFGDFRFTEWFTVLCCFFAPLLVAPYCSLLLLYHFSAIFLPSLYHLQPVHPFAPLAFGRIFRFRLQARKKDSRCVSVARWRPGCDRTYHFSNTRWGCDMAWWCYGGHVVWYGVKICGMIWRVCVCVNVCNTVWDRVIPK